MTLGATAPDESVTRPVIVEVPIWARLTSEAAQSAMATFKIRMWILRQEIAVKVTTERPAARESPVTSSYGSTTAALPSAIGAILSPRRRAGACVSDELSRRGNIHGVLVNSRGGGTHKRKR